MFTQHHNASTVRSWLLGLLGGTILESFMLAADFSEFRVIRTGVVPEYEDWVVAVGVFPEDKQPWVSVDRQIWFNVQGRILYLGVANNTTGERVTIQAHAEDKNGINVELNLHGVAGGVSHTILASYGDGDLRKIKGKLGYEFWPTVTPHRSVTLGWEWPFDQQPTVTVTSDSMGGQQLQQFEAGEGECAVFDGKFCFVGSQGIRWLSGKFSEEGSLINGWSLPMNIGDIEAAMNNLAKVDYLQWVQVDPKQRVVPIEEWQKLQQLVRRLWLGDVDLELV